MVTKIRRCKREELRKLESNDPGPYSSIQSWKNLDTLHQWSLAYRQKVPDGSGTARALDYGLKRWAALTRYLADGAVNWVDNQFHPWALGRLNWLLAGSLRSDQRAVAVMTLIQSAKLNGHDPYAYLKGVLTKLPTQKNNTIDELLRTTGSR